MNAKLQGQGVTGSESTSPHSLLLLAITLTTAQTPHIKKENNIVKLYNAEKEREFLMLVR